MKSKFTLSITADLETTADKHLVDGNWKNALTCYEEALFIQGQEPNLLIKKIIVLRELNRIDEAVYWADNLLHSNPGLIKAYLLRGLLALDTNDFSVALAFNQKAHAIDPENKDALLMLGRTYEMLDDFKQGLKCFDEAEKISGGLPEVPYFKALLYSRRGMMTTSISYFTEALNRQPVLFRCQQDFLQALKNTQFFNEQFLTEKLKLVVIRCFNTERLNHQLLLPVALLFFRRHPVFARFSEEVKRRGYIACLFDEKSCKEILDDRLIQLILRKCYITDLNFERFFTHLRKSLLLNYMFINYVQSSKNSIQHFHFGYQEYYSAMSDIALAGQRSGFIWSISEEEKMKILQLKKDFRNGVLSNDDMSLDYQARFFLLGMYEPPRRQWLERIDEYKIPQTLIHRTFFEFSKSSNLRVKIKRRSFVTDTTSRKVQRQYERFPYPAWTDMLWPKSVSFLGWYQKQFGVPLNEAKIADRFPKTNILVAGCGTGRHALHLAAQFPEAIIDAEDISLHSLAYGASKAEVFGIRNINFVQCDLVEPVKLKRKYALIECVGVLHHTKNVFKSWENLCSRLQTGGIMKIGLYSRTARQFIHTVQQKYLKSPQQVQSLHQLREWRDYLMMIRTDEYLNKLFQLNDFYSAAGFKDLLFHESESTFTLPEIEQMIQDLDLVFAGFDISEQTKILFRKMFPASNGGELKEWIMFEQSYPDTFIGMYQFWCRHKPLSG